MSCSLTSLSVRGIHDAKVPDVVVLVLVYVVVEGDNLRNGADHCSHPTHGCALELLLMQSAGARPDSSTGVNGCS